MTISIYSPQVRALSLSDGITELQAYRMLKAQELLRELKERDRQAAIRQTVETLRRKPTMLERIFGISPDWNTY